jgi:sec-independent protein translocase protein TatB
MNSMSFSETIFLFFLALVIFGPKRLPEIARQIGKMMAEFRRASNEFKAQIEQEIAHLEVEERRKTILPPSPPVEGTASRTLNAASGESSYPALSPGESGDPKPAETPVAEAATTIAASADQSVPNNGNAAPRDLSASEPVASSTSQESHA